MLKIGSIDWVGNEHCKGCPEFEPELIYDKLCANFGVCETIMLVRCKSAEKCDWLLSQEKGTV